MLFSQFNRLIFLLAFLLFFQPVSKVHAFQVTLAWDASTDPNIAGYKIHYGNASRNYLTVIDLGKMTSCTVANLSAGMVYYFACTAYDTSGKESDYSSEVAYTPPSTAFTITATAGPNGSLSPSGAVTVPPGGAQTFTITASAGHSVSEVKVDGISVGAVTSYSFGNVTVNHTITASFVPLPPSPNLVLALNAGGSEYTDSLGIRYAADQHFVGGAPGKSAATVRGTTDGSLYQDERYGNFSYVIPLANGSYDVTFKFVENTHSARGQRVFDLWVEGNLAISSLDIYAATGKNMALDLTFTVSVSDGVLNLDFLPSAGEAQVSAILITKASGTPKRYPGKLRRYFSTQTRTTP